MSSNGRREDRAQDQDTLRLRVIADTLPAYVAYVDADLRYAMVNRTYEDWFGRTAESMVGRRVADVLGASYGNISGYLEGALAGTPQMFETAMHTVDSDRTLLVRHIPDAGPDGAVRGVIVHGVDITERKRSEQVLVQTEKLAAVGRLASSIAHEINNPLESVVNLLYLIEQTALMDAEQTLRYARLAQAELQRVSQIATQTLRFFKQSTARTRADMAGLVTSVLALYAGRLLNSGVLVECRLKEGAAVWCFEGEVRQVLNHLVSNSIDAMRQGGRLLLRVRPVWDPASGRPGVRLTVADTGEGMTPEVLARIFEPFFTTRGISGTGLGMWVSSGIVEKHGGRLRMKSRPGVGTVTTLSLPEGEGPLPEAGRPDAA